MKTEIDWTDHWWKTDWITQHKNNKTQSNNITKLEVYTNQLTLQSQSLINK